MVSPSITISTAIDIVYYLHISNSSVAVGNYVLFVPSVDILFGVFFLPPVNYFNLLLYKKRTAVNVRPIFGLYTICALR